MIPIKFSIRSFRRFPIQCRVYYSHDEGHGSGTIWNLSLNGWRVDGSLPVRPGMVVSLWVLPPNDAPTLFVDRATVRWSRGLEFGLETGAIRENEAACLKRLVESLV
jgi:hypothetical protein